MTAIEGRSGKREENEAADRMIQELWVG